MTHRRSFELNEHELEFDCSLGPSTDSDLENGLVHKNGDNMPVSGSIADMTGGETTSNPPFCRILLSLVLRSPHTVHDLSLIPTPSVLAISLFFSLPQARRDIDWVGMELFARDSDEGSFVYLANFTLLGSSAIWGIGISQTLRYFLRRPNDREDEPGYLSVLVRSPISSSAHLVDSSAAGSLAMIHYEKLSLSTQVSYLCFDLALPVEPLPPANTLYFNTVVWYQHLIWVPGVLMPYLFSALVALSAQTFFTYRIWVLSEKKLFIPIIAVLPILFQLCFPPILFYSIDSHNISTEIQKDLLLAILVVGAAVDISISGGLCALLWRHYIVEGPILNSTRSLLQRMMLLSVNTGMWTALISCGTVIIFFRSGSDHDWKFFAYFHILSPLYYTTVLANLNARSYLRQQSDPALPSDLLTASGGRLFLAGGGLFDDQILEEIRFADVGNKEGGGSRPSADTLQPDFMFKSYAGSDDQSNQLSPTSERIRSPEHERTSEHR
ncbi:hypothetical protein NLJ89_g7422 [Agrocybe chaxingu]|uniref:DUF6534 domain-containing protein n=1 Tax=Agrocybe chaxingu TaxID=84603 RepID=A0A9W8JWU9_9AGAR|nr:hypothetical protein NLJ89_g7422 [Agrocybe chaxingu]